MTKKKSGSKKFWLISMILVLIIGIYLNRAYAYFFDYLGAHEISPPMENGYINYFFWGQDSKIKTLRYYALGDSLTKGVGVKNGADSYPYQIANNLSKPENVNVVVYAVPGAKTGDVLSGQISHLSPRDIDLVTVLVGINDVLGLESSDQFKQEYALIIDKLTPNKNIKLVVINIPYLANSQIILPPYNFLVDYRTRQFNSIIDALVRVKQAQGANIEYVDLYSQTKQPFSSDQSLYSEDKFHPSAKGYRLWSQIINEQTLF